MQCDLFDFSALIAKCNTNHLKTNASFPFLSILDYQYHFAVYKLTLQKIKSIMRYKELVALAIWPLSFFKLCLKTLGDLEQVVTVSMTSPSL